MKRIFVSTALLVATSSGFASSSYSSSELEMPGWLLFIALLMITWGVLEIILFFKIWGMTNDVRRLTNQFCPKAPMETPAPKPINPDKYEVGEYDRRLDNVKIGDKVRRLSDGKILEVVSIGENSLECRGGMLDGILSYPKDSLAAI